MVTLLSANSIKNDMERKRYVTRTLMQTSSCIDKFSTWQIKTTDTPSKRNVGVAIPVASNRCD